MFSDVIRRSSGWHLKKRISQHREGYAVVTNNPSSLFSRNKGSFFLVHNLLWIRANVQDNQDPSNWDCAASLLHQHKVLSAVVLGEERARELYAGFSRHWLKVVHTALPTAHTSELITWPRGQGYGGVHGIVGSYTSCCCSGILKIFMLHRDINKNKFCSHSRKEWKWTAGYCNSDVTSY